MQIVGQASSLGWVALKAALLFLTAVAGFRISGRRLLAEMAIVDFLAAVAVGAIIGRVPNSSTTSYLQGAVTLIVILVLHNLIARLRFLPRVALLVDHRPRLLVENGRVRHRELRRCGLTPGDLFGLLRQRGIVDLSEVRYVVFEQRGNLSVVRSADDANGDLLDFAHTGGPATTREAA